MRKKRKNRKRRMQVVLETPRRFAQITWLLHVYDFKGSGLSSLPRVKIQPSNFLIVYRSILRPPPSVHLYTPHDSSFPRRTTQLQRRKRSLRRLVSRLRKTKKISRNPNPPFRIQSWTTLSRLPRRRTKQFLQIPLRTPPAICRSLSKFWISLRISSNGAY